jgi:hypothetical protein
MRIVLGMIMDLVHAENPQFTEPNIPEIPPEAPSEIVLGNPDVEMILGNPPLDREFGIP